jgi:hypothetical protein
MPSIPLAIRDLEATQKAVGFLFVPNIKRASGFERDSGMVVDLPVAALQAAVGRWQITQPVGLGYWMLRRWRRWQVPGVITVTAAENRLPTPDF